ncbi:MAG: pilus assembly protein [Deltaproteobacteria bacterium]|nr:pilus assembly protein [Deltaproteobacteria bacterium]
MKRRQEKQEPGIGRIFPPRLCTAVYTGIVRVSRRFSCRDHGRSKVRAPLVRGSAVTEMALLSIVLVPALLYAVYFFDIIHVMLKVQEAARYAVWEFTGYNLHDYNSSKGKGHKAKFDSAKSAIEQDVKDRFANLVSTDKEAKSKSKKLAIDWNLSKVDISSSKIPVVSKNLADVFQNNGGGAGFGQVLDRFNMGMNKILQDQMNFNSGGQVTAKITIQARATIFPQRYLSRQWGLADSMLPRKLARLDFTEDVTLVADSWKLFDGSNYVTAGKGKDDQSNKTYFNQLKNVAFFGLEAGLTNQMQQALAVMDTNHIPNPWTVVLRSRAYKGGDHNSGRFKFKSGYYSGDIDGGIDTYNTSPMEDGPGQSEYMKTFDKRGDYYMGCKSAGEKECSF